MANLQCTIVFQKTWDAIHAKNEDGSRKYKYIIHKGSSRSSKTLSIIDACDLYARSEEGKRITVWRDTKTDCKKTVLVDTVKHLKKTGRFGLAQIFNKTESIFTYATDCTFEIHGTEDAETVHGLTQQVAWLNEPYKIPKEVFDQIDQRTSDFVIIDMNPKLSHWVEDLEKDSRSIVIHSTFKDNPFCPIESRLKILSYQPVSMCTVVLKGLINELEAKEYDLAENELGFTEKQLIELTRCRENEHKNSADTFNWSVYGLGMKAERPNRIFKWEEISDDQYNALDVTEIYAVDWGAVDPWAILAAKYYDGCLYFKELNYLSENEIRAKLTPTEIGLINSGDEGLVTWYFNKFNIPKNAAIVCDNNRLEKIAALRRIGYSYAVAAAKGPGSLLFGIETLRNIKCYYTKSSKNIAYEQENYSFKVDRYGITMEEPEDLNNHCFVGETLITTINGKKSIKDISENELVLTSKGFKRVLFKWCNGIKEVKKYSIVFDIFSLTLECTQDHLIKTNKGWIKISKLESGMTVFLTKHLMKLYSNYTQVKNISAGDVQGCTLSFMNFIMINYRKASKFITSTKIHGITTLKTLLLKRVENIFRITAKSDLKITQNLQKHSKLRELLKHQNGINHQKVLNGINSMQKKSILEIELTDSQNVTHADLYLQKKPAIRDFALINAKENQEGMPELIISKNNAQHAANPLLEASSSTLNIAVPIVVTSVQILSGSQKQVYDLTVDEQHEYFANDVLVHNCIDGARFVTDYLRRLGVIKKM